MNEVKSFVSFRLDRVNVFRPRKVGSYKDA